MATMITIHLRQPIIQLDAYPPNLSPLFVCGVFHAVGCLGLYAASGVRVSVLCVAFMAFQH